MKASKLLEVITGHIDFYGDTDIDICSVSGESFNIIHWDHYKDSLYIEVKEVDEGDDEQWR